MRIVITYLNQRFFLIFFGLSTVILVNGQAWPKIYGDSFTSNIRNLKETYDNGYIIAGNISVNKYIWIIKTDINGEIIWDKKVGNPSNYRSYVNDLELTSDRGFIIAGGSKKYDLQEFYDPVFIKFDSCANFEWCRVLLSPDNNLASSIVQNDDGTYMGMLKYFGGDITTVRISLLKMDETGEPIWIKHLCQEDPGIYNEEGWHLINTKTDNYLITGRCDYPGVQPFWILTDTTGDQLWDLMAGNPNGQAHRTIESDTGTYYSTSSCEDSDRPPTPVIFKFNHDGTLLEKYFLLGDTITRGTAYGISKLNDTSLAVGIAWSDSQGSGTGYSEILLTDTSGSLINRRLLLNEDKSCRYVITTQNDKILTGGNFVVDNNWDIYLWKLNSDLEFDSLNTQPLTYDSLCPYPIVSDTIDYECDLFVNIEDLPTQEEYEQTLKVFPNPASEYVVFDMTEKEIGKDCVLSIYNSLGIKVEERSVTINTQHLTLNIQQFIPGPYIAVLRNDNRIVSKGKFVVAKY